MMECACNLLVTVPITGADEFYLQISVILNVTLGITILCKVISKFFITYQINVSPIIFVISQSESLVNYTVNLP